GYSSSWWSPCCRSSWRNARYLPHGRFRAGDRHLNFYETRDNLATGEHPDVVVQRHSEAIVLCARCPVLDRCVEWYESLPRSKRPFGVVAGIVNRPKAVGRPRKSA
ncbi:MAG: WhiB family transcriptional regulator, partial [Mycolicibacterium sp.]